MSKKPTVSAVIIAKNEENVIKTCLETIKWCDNIIVIDNGSTDKTTDISESFGSKVVYFSHKSFARIRNEALKHIKKGWIFYIDADERLSIDSAQEILETIVKIDSKEENNLSNVTALSFKRKNICYGNEFKHGGWENDNVTRIFKLDSFKKWTGDIHESPNYKGEAKLLNFPLIHHTHRNTTDGLNKTISWTKMEAKLLADSNIPKVTFFTILRKGFMEFIRRSIIKKGYKDGLPGMIEALVQGINRILVYIQVWEMQQGTPLDDQYKKRDSKIIAKWRGRL